jgi:hypothetical protein
MGKKRGSSHLISACYPLAMLSEASTQMKLMDGFFAASRLTSLALFPQNGVLP